MVDCIELETERMSGGTHDLIDLVYLFGHSFSGWAFISLGWKVVFVLLFLLVILILGCSKIVMLLLHAAAISAPEVLPGPF